MNQIPIIVNGIEMIVQFRPFNMSNSIFTVQINDKNSGIIYDLSEQLEPANLSIDDVINEAILILCGDKEWYRL